VPVDLPTRPAFGPMLLAERQLSEKANNNGADYSGASIHSASACRRPCGRPDRLPPARHRTSRRQPVTHSVSETFGQCGRERSVAEQKRPDDQIFVDAHWSDSRRCARRKCQRLCAALGRDALRSFGRIETSGGSQPSSVAPIGRSGSGWSSSPNEPEGLPGRTSSAFDSVAKPVVRRHLGGVNGKGSEWRSVRRRASFGVAISRPERASCCQLTTVGSKVVRVRESEESNVGVLR
jgi:hypothetical protein